MAVIIGYKITVLTDISIYCSFNPFQINSLFLHPLKTTENQRFSDVFRGYRKRPMTWNGLVIKLEQARKIIGTTERCKIFKNGPSKICGRQPSDHITSKFLKAVFHKFYLVHFWILVSNNVVCNTMIIIQKYQCLKNAGFE